MFGVVGIAALAVFMRSDAGFEPDTQSTTTALAVPESSAATSGTVSTCNAPSVESTTSTTAVREQTLSDLLPEAEGVLVAAILGRGGGTSRLCGGHRQRHAGP